MDPIQLTHNVTATLLSEEDSELERMIEVVTGTEFLDETDRMFENRRITPFTLLVYKDILALGVYTEDGMINVGVKKYSNDQLLDWVDKALSLFKHPLRVVNMNKSDFAERLASRASLGWIDYNPSLELITEKKGVKCPAENFLESNPPNKDLYAISKQFNEVEVAHLRIDIDGNSLQCLDYGTETFNLPIGDVEDMMRLMHPDSLVLREPLAFCSAKCDNKPYACLAVKFESVYARKAGFLARPKSDYFLN